MSYGGVRKGGGPESRTEEKPGGGNIGGRRGRQLKNHDYL